MAQVASNVDRPPWHIRRSGFPTAWRLADVRPSQQRPVRVAILDSGIDLRHPQLQRLLGQGVNLLREGEPPADENGHGTHVAGIIALAAGALRPVPRPSGVVIHPVKIFDRTGFGRIADIVKGLYWCADHGIDVVNLSFGTDLKTSEALQRAVRDLEETGILLVAAAGNDGRQGAVDFPGRYNEVLAVAASTRQDRLAPFSSSGEEVDLVAPGSGVLSLAPGGGFLRMSGTSMAAPHVSAAAALLLGLEPYLSPAAVRQRLRGTAEWLPGVSARAQGSGLLRADLVLRGRP
jgi:subtilisin